MYSDVQALRDFYATALGAATATLVARRIRSFWPDVRGECVAGLGYAPPVLGQFVQQARRCLALMPGPQGVVPWPDDALRRSALVEPDQLPLADAAVDRLLVIHGLEHAQPPAAVLAEAWRVLAGQGRLLVVVPNRRGLWARFDTTPFGTGHPFSQRQVERLLADQAFDILRHGHSLFFPPLERPICWRLGASWESFGRRFLGTFAGVRLVEARKRLFAPTPRGKAALRPQPVPIPARAGAPVGVTPRPPR